ncbi:zf-CCHC domain-containing protein [Tanacetum coccineum]|uniref:Zf-CCHC domain-containing protein n=1 Tax=Tanacetum coccineum TaxID=301880 RepID=A0ABQ5E7U6_9ASTR
MDPNNPNDFDTYDHYDVYFQSDYDRYTRDYEAYEHFLALFEQEAGGSSSGPKRGRTYTHRERETAEQRLIDDYFDDDEFEPKYPEDKFKRRYRMSSTLFNKIVNKILSYDVEPIPEYFTYFKPRYDATGRLSIGPILKCTSAIRQLVYDTAPDAFDEYLQIAELHGNYKPTIKNKDGKDVVITYDKFDENQKKMISKNDKAKMVLYNVLPKKEYKRNFMYNTTQDIWNSLIITHQGNKQVKDNKIDLFVQKYEEFIISDDESIDCAFFIFNTIITSLKALDESFLSRNNVRKFLRALPTKWHPKKDLEVSKNKKEKYKSLALKERKVLSEEDASYSDSNDEEYAMAVRDFKKYFRRRGKFVRQPYNDKKNFRKEKEDKKEKEDRTCFKCSDPNHFISDCPKHSFGDQKAFVVSCWSDSGDDSKKEEICLMAQFK